MVDNNTNFEADSAVVLVALEGSRPINYMQFCHSSAPCLNYRFSGKAHDVLAFKMKKGLKNGEINSITHSGSPSGYTSSGMNYGYVAINDKKITLDQSGIYFHIILNTDTLEVKYIPTPHVIDSARIKYPELFRKLRPINF